MQGAFQARAREDVVVLDNGGCTIKAGLASNPGGVRCVPNCTAKPKSEKRLYVGDEVDELRDISAVSLRRPVDRGFLVNGPLEKDIWERTLRRTLKVNPAQCSLLVTEPLFNLPALMTQFDELIFEQFGFRSALIAPAPALVVHDPLLYGSAAAAAPAEADPALLVPPPAALAAAQRSRTMLVLDCGFSYTHAVPIFDGRVQLAGVRRINIGGKALTNHLKELVSYRAMNMMDEYLLMERVKERLCYVARDALAELAQARLPRESNPVAKEYVLPDGVSILRGYVKGDDVPEGPPARRAAAALGPDGEPLEQLLPLCNERFMVPEALMHPTDIGAPQAGLPEAAAAAVAACSADARALLWANVVLVGGTSQLPGLEARLRQELRPLAPAATPLGVRTAAAPVLSAWRGGAAFAASEAFAAAAMSREEYFENGTMLRIEYEQHGTRPPRGRMW